MGVVCGRHRENGRIRVLMRQDKTMKVAGHAAGADGTVIVSARAEDRSPCCY